MPTNQDYPHAPWWSGGGDIIKQWGYNPTACLAGFILCYAKPHSAIYQKAESSAIRAAESCLTGGLVHEMHETICFIRLRTYLEQAKRQDLFDLEKLTAALRKLIDQLISQNPQEWSGYACKPSRFIRSPRSRYYPGYENLLATEISLIIESRQPDGVWPVTWAWGCDEQAFAISANWWQASIALENALLLQAFDGLPPAEKRAEN